MSEQPVSERTACFQRQARPPRPSDLGKRCQSKGGLLGRKLQMICIDDETDPKLVPEIYKRLLDDEKVDLVIGGYRDNSGRPARPLLIGRKSYLVAVMAPARKPRFHYSNPFLLIPTGPPPHPA